MSDTSPTPDPFAAPQRPGQRPGAKEPEKEPGGTVPPGAEQPPPRPPAAPAADSDSLAELAADLPHLVSAREHEAKLPRPQKPPRGRRLAKKADPPPCPLTPEQRLLVLDAWQRSGLPAGEFAPLVGLSKHTLYPRQGMRFLAVIGLEEVGQLLCTASERRPAQTPLTND
jgi:hypothetical protein